jgi:hypothetical protein
MTVFLSLLRRINIYFKKKYPYICRRLMVSNHIPEIYVPRIVPAYTKVLVELEVSNDEMIRMGLKDKIIQVLDKQSENRNL